MNPSDDAPSPGAAGPQQNAAREAATTVSLDTGAQVTHPGHIGRYRIVSVLGTGGMGTVYEAEQQQPRRPVALKVIRGGRYVDEHCIRLFQREAQTLARLKHSNIAAIYETGRTQDGQHFFAMELVRGQTLTQYLHARQPTLRDRLKLFCTICQAIHYAHQRAVIHRDLKPSNILIDYDGHPKVLDFGLARMTDVDIAVATVVTEAGRIQGTLAYMSPEQARGNPDEIDLRSDIYSLGVILFELLTGKLPYEVGQSALHESVRAICEDKPVKPSTLDRGLRGDLETIVLKALAKEPARRYQSAAALGEDLERYLANQPVLARPPSAIYQFKKLVARHKLPFALMAALFAVVLGFGIWMSMLYSRAERLRADAVTARDAEREEHRLAETISSYLVDMFKQSHPIEAKSKDLTARDILDRGAERIETELRDQPKIRATIMDRLGESYFGLGHYDRAAELLEEALDLRRGLSGDDDQAVAETLMKLGLVMKSQGNYDRAGRSFSQALEVNRRLLGSEHLTVASNLLYLAATLRDQGDYVQAGELVREALGIRRKLLGRRSLGVAYALADLALVRRQQGDLSEAERLVREALAIQTGLQDPDDPNVAFTMQSLAELRQAQGDYQGALELYHDALAKLRNLYDDDHPYITASMIWLGALLRDLGEYPEAEPYLREGLDTYRANLGDDHAWVASAKRNLAWLLFDTGDYSQAGTYFSQALGSDRATYGDRHPKVAQSMLGLGRVRQAVGDLEAAETHLREALAFYREAYPQGHWWVAAGESALGGCLVEAGRYEEAEQLLLRSYQTMSKIRGAKDRYALEALRRIVRMYDDWGKTDQAAEWRAKLPQEAQPR